MSLPTEDKARKALPIWSYLMGYSPDALLAVVGVAVAGNEQHNPGEPLHWDREKSKDQMNTAFRHLWDHGRGTTRDIDGQYHLAKAIWRISAELQLQIESDRRTSEAAVKAEALAHFQRRGLESANAQQQFDENVKKGEAILQRWVCDAAWGSGLPSDRCVHCHNLNLYHRDCRDGNGRQPWNTREREIPHNSIPQSDRVQYSEGGGHHQ